MSALQTWIQPAPVLSATSTALDWATTAQTEWFLLYPASARAVPCTDIYFQSIRLDMSSQPNPLFQAAMLTDCILFQEWLDSIRKYYFNTFI